MTLASILPAEHVLGLLPAAGKAELLSAMCRAGCARIGLDATDAARAVLGREDLGSTGIGGGIGLPHARVTGLKVPVGFFARLERPIEFAAIDGLKVDLVFLLLSPAEGAAAHLGALALIARRLRQPPVCGALRKASDPMVLWSILTDCGAGAGG